MDDLKISLYESGVKFTENTLVIVENDRVDGLSKSTFVSTLYTVDIAIVVVNART